MSYISHTSQELNPHERHTFVISDIHGHKDGLQLLLAAAQYRPMTDRLIMLGDYVDADPLTWDILPHIQQLVSRGASALLGNQEQRICQLASMLPSAQAWQPWLDDLPLYLQEDGYLFVHAGIRPGVPLEKQTADDLLTIREPFFQAPPSSEYTVIFGHTPTFKLGAEPGELWVQEGRLGIDTGAKHGCRLTLIDLQEGLAYSCSTAASSLYEDLRVKPFK